MDFKDLIQMFIDLGLKVIPLLGVIAFLIFLFGVGRFIRSSGSSKERDTGVLTWGVIALFVLFTVWGIISFIRGEFRFGGEFGIPQLHIEDVHSTVH